MVVRFLFLEQEKPEDIKVHTLTFWKMELSKEAILLKPESVKTQVKFQV